MIWHEELYKICKRGQTFGNSFRNRGFRLFTKRQLLYVVAGGTSIHVFVDQGSYRIVNKPNIKTKSNIGFLQITFSWYLKNKDTFDQCLTYQNEIKQVQKNNRSTLDSFFKVVGKETKQ